MRASEVDSRTIAADKLHAFVDSLGLPVLGYLRHTQNYIHLAARGLTLFDVAPGRVERDLQALGYPVVRSPYTFGFAAVHGIRDAAVSEDGSAGGSRPSAQAPSKNSRSCGLWHRWRSSATVRPSCWRKRPTSCSQSLTSCDAGAGSGR